MVISIISTSALPIATASLLSLPVAILRSVTETHILVSTREPKWTLSTRKIVEKHVKITSNKNFTLTDLQNTLVVVDQISQFISKLERHGLQTRRFGSMHNYTLSGLIQGSLNNKFIIK
jgi:hypothetical protein